VTVMVSSGDSGAPGAYDTCLCSGVSDNGVTSNGYNPSFPASCPYVTAVGGTMGPESGGDEVVCQGDQGGVITSGGGFSSHFSAGSWQTESIATYFSGVSSAPVSGYNANGRGYPDISLIAVNYQVMLEGQLATVFGTSASAPVFAGFVSLINAARLNASLSSIGFLNPTLYSVGNNASSPLKFTDVTSGNNKCCAELSGSSTCCSTGFDAATGWDPTTGWGTIDYETFSTMYAVSTPYHASSKNSGYSWQVILVGVIIILAAISLLCCCCGYVFAPKKASHTEHHAVSASAPADHHVAMTPVYVQHQQPTNRM